MQARVLTASSALRQKDDEPTVPALTDADHKRIERDIKISHYFLDRRNFPWPIAHYIDAANVCFKCKEEGETFAAYFDGFIIFCICIAGVMVGIQTYPSFENEEVNLTQHPAIPIVNNIILVAFIVEAMVKICAEGMAPWRYFAGPEWRWNMFDFCIVILSMPFLEKTVFSTDADSVKILRLFRLARLAKLVNKVPKLRMIVMGLVGGLQSITYIMLLLLLVFYMFGIAGMSLFSANDPFHFNTVPRAILSLFRAATLEDWSDIAYISIYGCQKYPGGMYARGTNEDLEERGVPKMYRCTNPEAQPFLAAVYWVLFVMICSFVMLSLFIGVITIAMSDSIKEMQQMQVETQERRRKAKRDRIATIAAGSESEETTNHSAGSNLLTFAQRMQMQTLVKEASELLTNERFSAEDELAQETSGAMRTLLTVSKKCALLAESTPFTNLIIVMILLAGVAIGIESTLNMEKYQTMATILSVGDTIINIIFTLEVAVKVVAEGKEPLNYLKSHWNKFDAVVTLFSWPVIPGGDSSNLKILRIFRLFRVLKLLSRFPDLAMIVNALISGFESIGFISLIMVLVFYLFAVLGVSMFRDNDPWHFGTLDRAMLTLFRIATYEDFTDVMYINILGCEEWSYNGDDSLPKGGDCNDSNGQGALAAFYFIVFAILSAMVLLTLFVGVVTTSMTEAGDKAKKKLLLQKSVDQYGIDHSMPPGVLQHWRKLFTLLDADETETLDCEEVKIVFVRVGVIGPTFNVGELFSRLERDGIIENSDELNILDFVKFMHVFGEHSKHGSALKGVAPSSALGTPLQVSHAPRDIS